MPLPRCRTGPAGDLVAAESGMAEMLKVYDGAKGPRRERAKREQTGRELYMGAGDREHD